MRVRSTMLAAIAIVVLAFTLVPHEGRPQTSSQQAPARTIELTTTQVTEASVTVSPDGRWLIFTMLGHLFRLPVAGGAAEQLTFGPYYDADPVFSPEGSRVAFVSDRDGSDGNVFVLNPANGQITQLTREQWVGRPTWRPDGQAIVYLSFVGGWVQGPTGPAVIRSVPLGGGEPVTLVPAPQLFRSAFYLPDGRLGWAVVQPGTGSQPTSSRLEIRSLDGTVQPLVTIEGDVQRVVTAPTGEGLYCRILRTGTEDLIFLSLSDAQKMAVATLRHPFQSPQFGTVTDNSVVYLGDAGQLWNISRATGSRQPIVFTARVRLEIRDPIPPLRQSFSPSPRSMPPRSIVAPQLSPDGLFLVFGAAWHLWRQPLNGGPAERLTEGAGFDLWPALSPDGQQIAFVHFEHGKEEVRSFHLQNKATRTLASGGSYLNLSWSPDGQRLVLVEEGSPNRIVAVSVADGRTEKLVDIGGTWIGVRPHFSRDAQSLYFTQWYLTRTTRGARLRRLPLTGKAALETVSELEPTSKDGLVSPDEKWLIVRRDLEIWVAPLGGGDIDGKELRRLSTEGGRTFTLTPDGSSVIYAAAGRVWRHPLAGGDREEIPIRLALEAPAQPPVLLRRVRLLNFQSSGFRPETSLFLERGRIQWIGSERGRQLPRETRIVDAGGRFAIPGLFDMHVHSFRYFLLQPSPEAILAYGVTSVRDAGGRLDWLKALADRSETSNEPLPRYFFSGEFFRGEGHGNEWDVILESDDEVRSYVRQWKEEGAHFLKVSDHDRAVAEEAHRQGMPLVAHGTSVEAIVKRVTLGYTSLEHNVAPGRVYNDVLQMLALAGTRWDPTLITYDDFRSRMRDEPARFADRKFRAFIPWWDSYAPLLLGNGWYIGKGGWIDVLASVREAHQLGVKLLAGTDLPVGPSIHWELELLADAGVSPLDVLRIATHQAAEVLGADDDLGTLETGKLADIVLLDKNPLENIRNTQTIWRVIKGGWLFDPDTLRPPATSSTPAQR